MFYASLTCNGGKIIGEPAKSSTEGKPHLSGQNVGGKNQKPDKIIDDRILKSFSDRAIFHNQYAKIRVVCLLLSTPNEFNENAHYCQACQIKLGQP